MFKVLICLFVFRSIFSHNWIQPGYDSHLTYRHPKETKINDWDVDIEDSFDAGELIIDTDLNQLLLQVHGHGTLSYDLLQINMDTGKIEERIPLFSNGFVPWRELKILKDSTNDFSTAVSMGWGYPPDNSRGVVAVQLNGGCQITWTSLTSDISRNSWVSVVSPLDDIVVFERDISDDNEDKYEIIGAKVGDEKELWSFSTYVSFSQFTVDEEGYVYTFSNTSILRINAKSGDYGKYPMDFVSHYSGETYKISVANTGKTQLYFTDDINVFAVDKTNGKIVWKTKINDVESFCTPVGINEANTIVSASCNNSTYLFDSESGKIIKKIDYLDESSCKKTTFLKSGRVVVVCAKKWYLIEKDFSVKSILELSTWHLMGPIFDISDCMYHCVYDMQKGRANCHKKCL